MKKNIGIIKIIGLLILFPLTVWELALKKTYLLYKENKQMAKLVIAVDTIQANSSISIISATDPLLSNGKILEQITDYLKDANTEIASYQPSLINENDSYKLYAGTMVLRGNFIGLVKTMNSIERMKLPIKLSSACFSYYPAKEKASNTIELTLIFQQVES